MEEIWNLLKTALLDTTNETCRKVKKHHHKRVTWGWNDEKIWLLLKKDGVGKCVSKETARDNTYRPNKTRNIQFTQQKDW